jgi:hypothetical protein
MPVENYSSILRGLSHTQNTKKHPPRELNVGRIGMKYEE